MTTYRYKTEPYAHQVKALRMLLQHHGGALFMEMRVGKTKVALDFAQCRALQLGKPVKLLVMCNVAALGEWPKEIEKHSNPLLLSPTQIRITTHDKAWRPSTYDDLVEWLTEPGYHRIGVCDESHKIASPGAKRSRGAHRLAKYLDERVVMTGTADTNGNRLSLFSQYKFYDEGIFGTNFSHFKRRYVRTSPWNPHIVLGHRRDGEFKRKVAPFTFEIKRDECFDMPPTIHTTVPVALDESVGVYTDMEHHAVVELAGEEVAAPHILTRVMRLQQITGGWLKGDEPDSYVRVGFEKEKALSGLLERLTDEGVSKVVIFARFLKELPICSGVAYMHGFKRIGFHGSTPAKRRQRAIDAFPRLKEPTAFIAQLDAGSTGFSLAAASHVVFYSHSYSHVNFRQACDRLIDPTKSEHVAAHHLVADGTVDETVLESLKHKKKMSDELMRDINRLRRQMEKAGAM